MGAMTVKAWYFDGIAEHDPMKVGGWGGSDAMRWVREVGAPGSGRFHVVDVTDMDDACGSDNEGHPRYAGELAEVDTTDKPRVVEACRSCGWDDLDAEGWPVDVDGERIKGWGLALVMFQYGAKAPLWSDSANAARNLVREARRESRACDPIEAPEVHAARMARPVNALGSTAAEFARGDFAAPLARGLAAGDKRAGIMAQMYRASGGRTLGGYIGDDVMRVVAEDPPRCADCGQREGHAADCNLG